MKENATENEQVTEPAYVNVTPIFNYSRDVEIVKRFMEQVTRFKNRLGDDNAGVEMIDYIEDNLDHVRHALSEIMADDIALQVQQGRFPIRITALNLHEFTQYEGGLPHSPDMCGAKVEHGYCSKPRASIEHTL